jgi:hypothetical protein
MIVKNANMDHFHAALAVVNARYAGNIKFKTLEPKGRRISFTLTVISSTIGTGKAKATAAGVSMGPNGRRIAAACWHVHGDFFDALFRVCPDAAVYSSGSLANPRTGKWITKDGGNWQDWNKGLMMYPKLASECCECHRNIRTEKILAAQGRI